MAYENLTYEEFADRIGISVSDAKARAEMAGLSEVIGPDGAMRIQVPYEPMPPKADATQVGVAKAGVSRAGVSRAGPTRAGGPRGGVPRAGISGAGISGGGVSRGAATAQAAIQQPEPAEQVSAKNGQRTFVKTVNVAKPQQQTPMSQQAPVPQQAQPPQQTNVNSSELRTLRQYISDLRDQLTAANKALEHANTALADARDERDRLLEGARQAIAEVDAEQERLLSDIDRLSEELVNVVAAREAADAALAEEAAAREAAEAALAEEKAAHEASEQAAKELSTSNQSEIERLRRQVSTMRDRGLISRMRNR